MKKLFDQITSQFEAFKTEAEAHIEKGNKAAGTRARKSALELSKLMKEFRKVSLRNRRSNKKPFADAKGFFY